MANSHLPLFSINSSVPIFMMYNTSAIAEIHDDLPSGMIDDHSAEPAVAGLFLGEKLGGDRLPVRGAR